MYPISLPTYALTIGLMMAVAQPSLAVNLPQMNKLAENTSVAAACTTRDLELQALMERHENGDLNATPTLLDIATLLQFARMTCATGDIASALTIYKSAMRQLSEAAHESEMPVISRSESSSSPK
jgi:hypothetical protein